MSKSTIFEMGPVDFAHFSSPPFKWLKIEKYVSLWRKRGCLKALKLSALNIFKAACNKTGSHRLIDAKIECHFQRIKRQKTFLRWKNWSSKPYLALFWWHIFAFIAFPSWLPRKWNNFHISVKLSSNQSTDLLPVSIIYQHVTWSVQAHIWSVTLMCLHHHTLCLR